MFDWFTIGDNPGDFLVRIDLTHTNLADLGIALVAPDGTRVPLVAVGSATGTNMTNTLIDDRSTVTFGLDTGPYSRTAGYLPAGNMLAALHNHNVRQDDALGNVIPWTLEITNTGTRQGSLNAWSIIATPDVSNFTVTGNPLGTDPDPAHPRTYRISFPPQQLTSSYDISLAPTIMDTLGNAIDTNLNAGLDKLRGVASSQVNLGTAAAVSHTGPDTQTWTMTRNVTGFDTLYAYYYAVGATRNIGLYTATDRGGQLIATIPNVTAALDAGGIPIVYSITSGGANPNLVGTLAMTVLPALGNIDVLHWSTVTEVYNSFNVPLPIGGPNPGTVTQSTITVTDSATNFRNLSVQLNITYPNDPDLVASLIAPNGMVVPLFTNVGLAGTRRTSPTRSSPTMPRRPSRMAARRSSGGSTPSSRLRASRQASIR